jgi:glycosyltransferase involved in cell wall biosynthesis
MKKVNIIIPTKDRLILLERAVDSIIKQKYTNWELFIVNDSKKKLNFSNLDPRIRVLNNLNKPGANGARNTGIDISNGDYIAFLDDDDTWHPDKLFKQVEIMHKSNAIMCYTGRNIVLKNKKININRYSYHSKIISSKITLYLHNYIGTTSTIIIKNNKNHNIEFDESLSSLQDYDFYFKIAEKGKIIGIPEPLVNYYLDKSIKQISDNIYIYLRSAWKIYLKQKKYYKILIIIPFIIILVQKIKRRLYYRLI